MGPVIRDPEGTSDLVEFPGSVNSDPKFSWFRPVGPTGIVFLNSTQLGTQYANDVFVGDINNGNLYHFKPNSTRTGLLFQSAALGDLVADDLNELQEVIFGTGFGGITDLKVGPDGLLYVLSFVQGKIFVISRASVFVPSEAPLVNLSTRASVQTGDGVVIGGLIIDGTAPKTVLIRGRGPSLSAAPLFVPGVLADPIVRLFSGQTLIAENNNWQDAPSCGGFSCGMPAQITATGMDPCQPNPGQVSAPVGCALESALLITLNPGAYTVQLSGVNGATGIGLVEVFEADADDSSQLVNLSTRARTQTADGVMIGGFIIDGSQPKTILIRGRGPSMSSAPFFVSGALADPVLRLFAGQSIIAENNNWQDAPNCGGLSCGTAVQIAASGIDPCRPNPGQPAAPAGCELESAILITLNPGAYTTHLSGANGLSGIGLVEIFQLQN